MTDITRKEMVGGTGIEPVTPTMSRFAQFAKALKLLTQFTSTIADCSRFTPVNGGQSRAKRGQVRHA